MKKRKMERTDILLLAVNAALAAGKRILEIYNQPQESWQVGQKSFTSDAGRPSGQRHYRKGAVACGHSRVE